MALAPLRPERLEARPETRLAADQHLLMHASPRAGRLATTLSKVGRTWCARVRCADVGARSARGRRPTRLSSCESAITVLRTADRVSKDTRHSSEKQRPTQRRRSGRALTLAFSRARVASTAVVKDEPGRE